MQTGYVNKHIDFMSHHSEIIAEMEQRGCSDKELRTMVYNLGLYAFRMYHNAGFPLDKAKPGLKGPRKLYSEVLGKYVDSRIKDTLEERVLAEAG